MMNFPFLLDEITGYIDVNSLSARFFCKNANSSQMTQFAEKPRAASELELNARIDDMFEKVSSPLFITVHPHFNHLGRYSYPVYTRPRSSRAVESLFAKIITFFSGKNVVSHNE